MLTRSALLIVCVDIASAEVNVNLQYFNAAVLVDPSHGASWHAWGMLEKKEGNFVAARDLWVKVRLPPDQQSSRLASLQVWTDTVEPW